VGKNHLDINIYLDLWLRDSVISLKPFYLLVSFGLWVGATEFNSFS